MSWAAFSGSKRRRFLDGRGGIVRAAPCVLVLASAVFAQEAAPEAPEAPAAPKLTNAGAISGVMHGQSGVWGVMRAQVRNPMDEAWSGRYLLHFDDMPTVQYEVPVWVPPHSDRLFFVPVRPPQSPSGAPPASVRMEAFEGQGLLLPGGAAAEQRIDNGTFMILKSTARLKNNAITAMLPGREDSQYATRASAAMRAGSGLGPRTYYLQEGSMPFLVSGWQGIDGLVIAKQKPDLDAAELEALRKWVISGGRLWVMIDRVQPSFMSALLRETWTVSVVDFIELANVCIRPHDPKDVGTWPQVDHTVHVNRNVMVWVDGQAVGTGADALAAALKDRWLNDAGAASKDKRKPRVLLSHASVLSFDTVTAVRQAVSAARGTVVATQRGYDEPVKLARVQAPGWEVLHDVNGWPASLRRRYGRGWVLATTLGARAWIRPRHEPQRHVERGLEQIQQKVRQRVEDEDEPRTGPRMAESSHMPWPALNGLSRWFTQLRVDTLLPEQAMRQMAIDEIGYKIIHRNVIVSALGLFVLVILGVGMGLHRAHRLEYVSVVGGAAALVVSLALVVYGGVHRKKLPLTLSNVQVVRLPSDEPYAVVAGVLGIYAPEQDRGPLSAKAGGVVWPDRVGQQYEQLRMVWDDFGKWTWDNLRLPSGAPRVSEFRHVADLARPVVATMTFSGAQIEGTVKTEPFKGLEDAILVTRNGHFAPVVGQDGSFAVAASDALRPGQFVRGTRVMVSEIQQRRAGVYEKIVGQLFPVRKLTGTIGERDQTMLLGWSSSLDMGFTLPQQFEHRDATLLAIPVKIERPAPGTAVTVPSAFIPFDRAPGGIFQLYDPYSRTWLAPPAGGKGQIRFQLPTELLPLQVQRAVLTLDLRARERTVSVLVKDGAGERSVFKHADPDGRIEVELDQSVLDLFDDEGGLALTVQVSAAGGAPTAMKHWQMNDLTLQVQGVVEAVQQ